MDYPKKLYYSISEVADITGVKAHVLRYWETEFPTLRPKKTRAGSRRYRQADIDSVLAIKELLYERGFKIAGARKALRQEKAVEPAAQPGAVADAPAQIDLDFAHRATAAEAVSTTRSPIRPVSSCRTDAASSQRRRFFPSILFWTSHMTQLSAVRWTTSGLTSTGRASRTAESTGSAR